MFIRISLSLAWAMSALGGVASLIMTSMDPPTALTVTGLIAAVALASMASLASLATATNNYRLEWVASWFAATALAPYALVYWYTVFTENLGRLSSGFLLTALLAFFVTRAIMWSAHAERLRLLHEWESGHD